MLPLFQPGDLVIGISGRVARVGDVIAFRHKGRELIKRIESCVDDDYFVIGDNQNSSTDSRSFGTIRKTDILGVIIMKVQPPRQVAAPPVSRRNLLWIPYLQAAIIVAALLPMLAFFEKVIAALQWFLTPYQSLMVAKVYAAFLALAAVFSLPFLFRMSLSPLARMTSMASLLLLPVVLAVGLVSYALYAPADYDKTRIVASGVSGSLLLFAWSLTSLYVLNGKQALPGPAIKVRRAR